MPLDKSMCGKVPPLRIGDSPGLKALPSLASFTGLKAGASTLEVLRTSSCLLGESVAFPP